MTAVPIAEAARLLGKPERTVRRWATRGKLPATQTADGWMVDLDELGHVAADGRQSGQVAASVAATDGQVADLRAYVADLRVQLEVKDQQISNLMTLLAQVQRALPAPAALRRDSDGGTAEPAQRRPNANAPGGASGRQQHACVWVGPTRPSGVLLTGKPRRSWALSAMTPR